MERLDRDRITVGHVVTSALGGEELVHVVAQSFGLEVEGHDKATALGQIEDFLHEEAREGRRCLLVVDEAQNLSVEALEELRMLSNFQLGSHPLLQTLLLGQPEFRRMLSRSDALEQLRQRVIAAHHLTAIQPEEVGPYIAHRLRQVGWDGRPAIEPAVFDELYRATGGVPRKINQVMTRLLLLGAVEERGTLDAQMVREVVAEIGRDTHAGGDDTQDASPPEAAAPAQPEQPPQHRDTPVDADDPGEAFAELLVRKDAEIAELQDAVVELAARIEALSQTLPDTEERGEHDAVHELADRLAAMTERLDEQERSVRHVLTLLIEWFEEDRPRKAA